MSRNWAHETPILPKGVNEYLTVFST